MCQHKFNMYDSLPASVWSLVVSVCEYEAHIWKINAPHTLNHIECNAKHFPTQLNVDTQPHSVQLSTGGNFRDAVLGYTVNFLFIFVVSLRIQVCIHSHRLIGSLSLCHGSYGESFKISFRYTERCSGYLLRSFYDSIKCLSTNMQQITD